MFDQMFGSQISILERSLDLRMMRQNSIAANVANSETPGYVAKDIDFEATMRQVVARMEQAKAARQRLANYPELNLLSGPEPLAALRLSLDDVVTKAEGSTEVGSNGNTVSLEREIAKLQENRAMFSVISRLLGKRFAGLAAAITSRAG